jgi:uncharacterized protein YacL
MKLSMSFVIRNLFFLTAAVLAVFGMGSFMRVNENPDMKIAYSIYAVWMFGDAIAMLVCGLYIGRQMKAIYWFAVFVLSLNIVLTIFDQFGLIDLLFSLLNIVTLAALIATRKEFLPQ